MFTEKLLQWYDEHQRSLPWRGETDPYKIWVSEIILQQTRVQQGWDYYLRFIETFPTVQALAMASEEEVLRLWQGLGYYSRARNMHLAAQQILTQYQGVFPNNYLDIRALKGIGDYTAAAIASIAFQLPYPAVDGNVLRIISRIFGIHDDISQIKTRQKITNICAQHIDLRNPGHFNQACMEFGAIWCTPKNPNCIECPFQNECYAFQHDATQNLPIKNNKIQKKTRYFLYFVNIYNNSILLEKRITEDIWKNLYQFPLIETTDIQYFEKQPADFIRKEVLTHQNIFAKFIVRNTFIEAGKNQTWVSLNNLNNYPMPKIVLELLEAIGK